MNRLSILALTMSAALLVTGAAGAELAISTFDFDTDGWTTMGGATAPVWEPSGGNPDGHIRAQDSGSGWWYFAAPAKFLGDMSAAYGGYLSFDLKTNEPSPRSAYSDVLLVGEEVTLYARLGYPPTEWTSYSFTLDSSAGWRKLSDYELATDLEVQDVLSGLTGLSIIGDLVGGSGPQDRTFLDNVAIVPEPATLALLTLGGLGLARRRRAS